MIKIKRGPETALLRTWARRGLAADRRRARESGGMGLAPPSRGRATTIIPRMQIRFTKMQGAGNDFVVLDETQGRLGLTPAHYRYLADRHFGVGRGPDPHRAPTHRSCRRRHRLEYVIHNADGGEVEQCAATARAASHATCATRA